MRRGWKGLWLGAVLVVAAVIAGEAFTAGSEAPQVQSESRERGGPVRPLAADFVKVYESPHPETIYCYSPGLARCPSGRLVATLDLGGPGVRDLPGPKFPRGDFSLPQQGKVFTSDDGGKTWVHRVDFPYYHARPFWAGKSLYVLGHGDDLMILRSDDEGQTWGAPVRLTEGKSWGGAPNNVYYANDCIYLALEESTPERPDVKGVSCNRPILLRAKVEQDLTRRENWTFASAMPLCRIISASALDYFGVPFFETAPAAGAPVPGHVYSGLDWIETNVVQFVDPDNYWCDPSGHTFHLWNRTYTGGTGYAAIAKVVENADGTMTTMLETVPSGKTALFVPCPGGQMKFHILYDEKTKLYWLLSSQATDSMTRTDRLPAERFSLPNNERHRLQLHFSKNCIDWCFAGIVAIGPSPKQSRHYASMVIDGDDLLVLSRSGDARANSAHNTDFISFHRVRTFRELVY
jgi:hypothetical protein